jgi:hypothetical protein
MDKHDAYRGCSNGAYSSRVYQLKLCVCVCVCVCICVYVCVWIKKETHT